ncbi:MAG: UDP-glucose 4-epimerase, partial [Clostridiales bacterium]|nr:UDP-glucose 4-epimerase [Clostridiales bacterium]
GVGYSVLDIIKAFEAATGVPVPVKFGPRRPGDVPLYYADPSKAEKLLGWKASRTLQDMCRDSWAFKQQNPGGYGA